MSKNYNLETSVIYLKNLEKSTCKLKMNKNHLTFKTFAQNIKNKPLMTKNKNLKNSNIFP